MYHIPGCLREYIRVPFADVNLLEIPDDLNDEQVLFIGDILSTGLFGVRNSGIQPGDDVVIFGAGPVGLATLLVAKLYSPNKLIVVGSQDKFRLDMALELGATHVILGKEENVVEKIMGLTDGKGVDIVIDTSASQEAIDQGAQLIKIRGKLSLIGAPGPQVGLPLTLSYIKNLSMQTGIADLSKMKRLLKLVQTGKIDATPLITHRMSLDEAEKAFEIFEKRTEPVIKIVLKP